MPCKRKSSPSRESSQRQAKKLARLLESLKYAELIRQEQAERQAAFRASETPSQRVGKGENFIIPRIPIIPTDLPFQFKRLQFPIKLSFAMTINKAQEQTLQVAGVNLEKPCFSHGQLYVACLRVSNAQNLHILAPNGKTYNIVYSSVLK
ncbi:unnamed protein product [Parnassius mnemosyne]|uniref:ATP-dependent DNA helicase n=1 Tax=Parnassius mnemosyne TaxID=213953 RepID=A0AAV1LUM4_9NEOP